MCQQNDENMHHTVTIITILKRSRLFKHFLLHQLRDLFKNPSVQTVCALLLFHQHVLRKPNVYVIKPQSHLLCLQHLSADAHVTKLIVYQKLLKNTSHLLRLNKKMLIRSVITPKSESLRKCFDWLNNAVKITSRYRIGSTV